MYFRYLLVIIYTLVNCMTPAPIMVMNLLAAGYLRAFKGKEVIKSIYLYISISIPFVVIHVNNGVEFDSYLKSYFGSIFILFTSISAALYISLLDDFDWYMRRCAEFFFCIFTISSIAFLLKLDFGILGGWYEHDYALNSTIYRYDGYMYEASHFGLVVAPVFFYFVTQMLGHPTRRDASYLAIVAIPLFATYSIGFWFTFLASLIVSFASTISLRKLRLGYWSFLLLTLGVVLGAVISDEDAKTRIVDILTFEDSSVNGRSLEAYKLATEIASLKSLFWGAGIGQVKELGYSVIIDFYKYSSDVEIVAIPSSAAEVLASFGIIGLIFKILILLYIYFKFDVKNNLYGNLLFLFFFIYQFYGSFMISTIEIFNFALACFMSIRVQGVRSAIDSLRK